MKKDEIGEAVDLTVAKIKWKKDHEFPNRLSLWPKIGFEFNIHGSGAGHIIRKSDRFFRIKTHSENRFFVSPSGYVEFPSDERIDVVSSLESLVDHFVYHSNLTRWKIDNNFHQGLDVSCLSDVAMTEQDWLVDHLMEDWKEIIRKCYHNEKQND